MIGSGDQSDLPGYPPLIAPLLYSSLKNVVNADLFYLLAFQQACKAGITPNTIHLAVEQRGASSRLFALLRLQVLLADTVGA